MVSRAVPAGAASLYLAQGVTFINETEAVFEGMIEGWSDAQVGGRLNSKKSVDVNLSRIRMFQRFTNEWPWEWTAAVFDEWMVHLVAVRKLAPSTIRAYQGSVRLFCDYICSSHYEWTDQCERRFGTHPVQICHEWNTVRHVLDYEGRPGRRALSRQETQRMLDHIDDTFERRLEAGKKGALVVFRDATLFKVIYGWGLRANEAARLEVTDFYRNPDAPEFGNLGVVQIRHGKGSRGSGPKRRTVISLREDAVGALRYYIDNVLPLVRQNGSNALWFSERGTPLRAREVTDRFGIYRDEIGLEKEFTPHCLRHSYSTHLIEEGFDPRFVQQQLGHAWAATTSIYTHVSGDFMNTMMRKALEQRRHQSDEVDK